MVGSKLRAVRETPWPPEPPFAMPPARTVLAPGRGELFLRDSGGDGPAVLLLHGWLASADLNWFRAYGALQDAGYRVLALDHRGHGRGLRTLDPFTLVDCAGDAAAALRVLDAGPAIVVGYSMGGAIAQLLARDHPDVVAGLVLSGTSQEFQHPAEKRIWRAMAAFRLGLSVAPYTTWRVAFKRAGLRESAITTWITCELLRHSPRDVAEAGRELGRFDSRPWIGTVTAPAAVVVTAADEAVSPRRQRDLAAALGAAVFEVPIDHLQIVSRASAYNPALLQALAHVGGGKRVAVA
jgi:3-oxoadipate enol-lactonase